MNAIEVNSNKNSLIPYKNQKNKSDFLSIRSI